MRRFGLSLLAGVVLLLGTLPGVGQAASLTTVRVAYVPAVLFAPLFVANADGYFKDEGIRLDLKTVPAGQDAMVFVANGQLDAAVVGISAGFFNDVYRGLDVRIVAPMGVIPKTGNPSPLMVAAKSHITRIRQLKGQTIGIAGGLGSTGSYMLAVLLKQHGLTLSDVHVENMSFPEMVTGMQNGSIVACIPPQPFSNAILKAHTGRILGKVGTGLDLTGVVFGGKFMRTEPQVATRFLVALLRGVRAVSGKDYGGAKNLAILAKATHLPLATLKGMDPYVFSPDFQFDLATLTSMQKVFMTYHLLSYSKLLTPSQTADFNFAHAAVKALGYVKGH